MIRIRGFRAIDEPLSCEKFIVGHKRVLESINVKEVSSNKHTWPENPDAYVIIVESSEDGRVLGGARIHKAGVFEPLPLEEATVYMDPRVETWVKEHTPLGAGEICGLWNSREVAGLGIGAVFLTRAAVAVAPFLGIRSLFALCAPYTVKMAEFVGYEIEPQVGVDGTFYYPKLDLIATAMILRDVDTLSKSDPTEREKILELRSSPNLQKIEQFRNKEVHLYFDLGFSSFFTNQRS